MSIGICPLSLLRKNDKAIIVSIESSALGIKLMEMGCLPGEQVCVEHVAPWGDPFSVRIGNYILALRKAEAEAIKVKKL